MIDEQYSFITSDFPALWRAPSEEKKEGKKRFDLILEDIKSIRIQGAENVAKAGIKAFLIKSDKKSVKKILDTRPTEPLMQNAIKFLIKSNNPRRDSIKFLNNLKKSHQIAVKKGSILIKNNMNIYTHCHSSTVIDILKYAKLIGFSHPRKSLEMKKCVLSNSRDRVLKSVQDKNLDNIENLVRPITNTKLRISPNFFKLNIKKEKSNWNRLIEYQIPFFLQKGCSE